MNAPMVPKREQKRSRVFLSAQIDAGTGALPARIRDISRSGALVESELAPKDAQTLELTCGTTTLQARVAWADRGWLGIEFFTPLLAGDLVDAGGTKLKVSAPRGYHSGEPLD